jgi:hypothetical protein
MKPYSPRDLHNMAREYQQELETKLLLWVLGVSFGASFLALILCLIRQRGCAK